MYSRRKLSQLLQGPRSIQIQLIPHILSHTQTKKHTYTLNVCTNKRIKWLKSRKLKEKALRSQRSNNIKNQLRHGSPPHPAKWKGCGRITLSKYEGGGWRSLCIGNSKPGPKEFNKIRIRTSMQEEKATTTIFIVRNTKNKIVKKRKNKNKDMEKGSLFFIYCLLWKSMRTREAEMGSRGKCLKQKRSL